MENKSLISFEKGNPLISILIPTKNRSFLVGYAIKSVLIQTFTNFELIVIDNDDNPEATKKVVTSYDD